MQYNREAIEKDSRDAQSRMSGNKFLVLKDGDEISGRMLPVWNPSDDEKVDLYVRYGEHYFKESQIYAICVNEPIVSKYLINPWPCPVCTVFKDLRDSKNEDDQELAKVYRLGIKHMMNFNPTGESEAKIVRFTPKTLPKLTYLAFGRQDTADVLDLKGGRDIIIKRQGSAFDTEYMVTPAVQTRDVSKSILDRLNDLYAEIMILPADVLKKVMKGGTVDDDDYISFRDLIASGALPGAKSGATSATKSAGASSTAGATRRAGKSMITKMIEWAKADLEVELDPDLDEDAMTAQLLNEAEGIRVKNISDPFKLWLEEHGAETEGKVVVLAVPEPKASAKAKGLSPADQKVWKGFADELGLEVDFDADLEDIVAGMTNEALDVKVKSLSDELQTWLEEHGMDCSGKTVAKAAKGPKAAPPAASDDEKSDVEKQIEKIRAARAGKK